MTASFDVDAPTLQAVVARTLAEDLGARGDVTSAAVIPTDATATADVVARAAGVIAGIPAATEVFRQVEAGQCGYGVVPVENTTEGSIGRTHDLLLATPLKICGEVLLPVHQCMMSKSGKPGAVKKIYSHSQSLAQCHEWLNQHYPQARRTPVVSNAEAARLAAKDAAAD